MADVMRAFFGDLSRLEPCLLEAPWRDSLHLESRLEPSVSAQEARDASRRGWSSRQVKVSTRCLGASQALVETIPLHQVRRVLKRQLYVLLSQETGMAFPWGTLTGVRPTQIALEAVHRLGREEAVKELRDYWRLSPKKADLAVKTALAEADRLSGLDRRDCLLYVGLPFCPSRCLYCSFITQDALRQKGSLGPYVQAVIQEAKSLFTPTFDKKIAAVYYGGGTPTALPAPLLKVYMEEVLRGLPLAAEVEMTMEAGRPDTLDREKLALIRQAGFHKLCINPQTMHDRTLKAIGRHHSVQETVEAFHLARSMGFDDINMDLIAGLPGEGSQDLLASLERVIALGPEQITLHSLAVKKGSYLDRLMQDRDLLLPDPALIEAVEAAHDLLDRHGYRPYYLYKQKNCRSGLENTGFTRGKGSLYNVAMMSDQVAVVGLGSGSTSKAIIRGKAQRLHNPKDLLLYQARLDQQAARRQALFTAEADQDDIGSGEETGVDMDGSQTGADDQ